MSGHAPRTTFEANNVAWRASAPITNSPASTLWKSSSVIRLISMRYSGRAIRKFIIGTKLCPPEITFAPGERSARALRTACTELGAIVKSGGLHASPSVAAATWLTKTARRRVTVLTNVTTLLLASPPC